MSLLSNNDTLGTSPFIYEFSETEGINDVILNNNCNVSKLNTSPILNDVSAPPSLKNDNNKDVNNIDFNICNRIPLLNISPNILNRNYPHLTESSDSNDTSYMCTPNILEGMSDLDNVNIPPNEELWDSVNDPYISELNSMENDKLSKCIVSELKETKSTHTKENDSPDIAQIFNSLRIENINKLVIGHLNINSLRNKFEALKCIIKDNLDIFVLSETKLDDTFPKTQFSLDGYNHFRFDKNSTSGGLIIFIREDIPCKILPNTEWPKELEGIFIEINLRKNKWLLFTGYNPHKQFISQFLDSLSVCIEKLLNKYDNILLLGDFNSAPFENDMNEFCNVYGLKNLIK